MARLLPLHQQNLLIATASTVVLALQVGTTAAQSEYFDVWADSQHPTPEYRAASVVTNLWLAAFAVTSCLFGVLGEACGCNLYMITAREQRDIAGSRPQPAHEGMWAVLA
eukprot:GHRR01025417.1.p2 GENE.GHRR01025417.1~~GHRR01025417.1.p2  ORF type:complete len:110 (+),score=27.55 GHRR01025417.1:327-656(+)